MTMFGMTDIESLSAFVIHSPVETSESKIHQIDKLESKYLSTLKQQSREKNFETRK